MIILFLCVGLTPVHLPGLPPEFMQAIVHQISHQAAAMAAAASVGHPAQTMSGPGSATSAEANTPPQPAHPSQARVVITRPSFSPRIPQSVGTRGATINLRTSVPTAGQLPGQVTDTEWIYKKFTFLLTPFQTLCNICQILCCFIFIIYLLFEMNVM